MEYPYFKNYHSEEEVRKLFKKLKKFHPEFTQKPLKDTSIISLRERYRLINRITDYFSETCRVKCSFNNNLPPLEKFKTLDLKLAKTYEKIDQQLYKNLKSCNNFNLTIVVTILKHFKPKRFFDPSAGWGDRMIGSMACDVEYLGVDPSYCMAPKYREMVEFLKPGERIKYRVIRSRIEDLRMDSETFDFVFTSPPFFKLEIYEDKVEQSSNYKSLSQWKSKFLKPMLVKCCDVLVKGGKFLIYVEDYRSHSGEVVHYVQYMKIEMKKLKMNYLGTINWFAQDGRKKIRNIYVWEK